MLTRRSMLAFLGLAPFAAKALANAKPEAPKPLTIVPPKGPVPRPMVSTAGCWVAIPPRRKFHYEYGRFYANGRSPHPKPGQVIYTSADGRHWVACVFSQYNVPSFTNFEVFPGRRPGGTVVNGFLVFDESEKTA